MVVVDRYFHKLVSSLFPSSEEDYFKSPLFDAISEVAIPSEISGFIRYLTSKKPKIVLQQDVQDLTVPFIFIAGENFTHTPDVIGHVGQVIDIDEKTLVIDQKVNGREFFFIETELFNDKILLPFEIDSFKILEGKELVIKQLNDFYYELEGDGLYRFYIKTHRCSVVEKLLEYDFGVVLHFVFDNVKILNYVISYVLSFLTQNVSQLERSFKNIEFDVRSYSQWFEIISVGIQNFRREILIRGKYIHSVRKVFTEKFKQLEVSINNTIASHSSSVEVEVMW